ncbi:MAG: serine protease [Patescibacteria group bacterium]
MKRAVLITFIFVGSLFLFSTQSSHEEIIEQKLIEEIPPPQPATSLPAAAEENNPPPPTEEQEELPSPTPPSPTPVTELPPPPPPKKPIAQSQLYTKGLSATVNFLCPNSDNTYTVATGAIIDAHGYIISNAHIVNKNNSQPLCTIRAGSPAVPIGKAKLVFIPRDYQSTLDEQAKAYLDISLWKLEESHNDWPHWDINFDSRVNENDEILTQSYPAELLSSEIIFKNLGLLFSTAIVSEKDEALISAHATISAQHGSSGGILIDPYTGKLYGIIFGISADPKQSVSERLLYAITPSRINAIIWQETKKQFGEYLATLPEPAY